MNDKKKLITIVLVTATIATFIIFGHILTTNSNNNSSRIKVAILKFSDSSKSQYANARPILNGYGFRGSFFITCGLIASTIDSRSMTWQNVATLQKEGHDIESGAMTYASMTNLSRERLDHEVQQSRQCLSNHGITSTVLGMPFGGSSNNSTIINTVAKYYDFSINGFSNLMFLHCDGWMQYIHQQPQSDCRTHLQNGSVTFANRYSIREWNHNTFDVKYSHDDAKIFKAFVNEVNRQTPYNYYGKIIAIPIISYHNIDDKKKPHSTGINLFADEMKYLHDNGFKVITASDLIYDKNNNFINVVGFPEPRTASE